VGGGIRGSTNLAVWGTPLMKLLLGAVYEPRLGMDFHGQFRTMDRDNPMELFGKQQHLYFINEDLADRVKALAAGTLGVREAGAALGLAWQAFSLADQLITYFEAENELPHAIACREGCSFCCYNQVEVTPLEALGIGHYVGENFSGEDREALMARVRRALDLKAGKGKKELARLRQQFPCPLLAGGRCSIYPVRPLVCRAMHTFEARACEDELRGGKLGPGEYYAHRYEFVRSISAGLQNGCREVRCQTGILDLVRGLQDFFSREDPVGRWLKGEEVFGGQQG
jgi:Fe-S-cluster containining protein